MARRGVSCPGPPAPLGHLSRCRDEIHIVGKQPDGRADRCGRRWPAWETAARAKTAAITRRAPLIEFRLPSHALGQIKNAAADGPLTGFKAGSSGQGAYGHATWRALQSDAEPLRPAGAGAAGVQITDLKVPAAVRNGSSSAVLDCEYSLKPEDQDNNSGLVVKWFFNNSPEAVYQWIPEQKPQDLGALKGRLNLDYLASDNKYTKHRALSISNPTTDLTGDYRCSVSTFKDEDFMNKKMVVFEPGRELDFRRAKPTDDSVNVTCVARSVFPEPKLHLFAEKSKDRWTLPDLVIKSSATPGVGGAAYEVRASAHVEDSNLESPTIFGCEMHIPGTTYVTRKTLVYYPGLLQPPNGGPATWRPRQVLPSSAMALLLLAATCC
ncbi:uncharacterized protein LOC124795700 [Schistocerca piceifrons]|uniref:uncharacterized protein LOC124795700 n=1 Tax=Schistocerca piceifrons TaxID=274613 RepID=UPI001F5F8F78|nr:uncharacterized protein LOC124795700 [Schistocerca piceifrons]